MKRLLVALGIVWSSHSGASAEIKTSLTGFQIQLFDLDISDGIAPSLAVLPYNTYYNGGAIIYLDQPNGTSDTLQTKYGAFDTLARSFSLGDQAGSFYISGGSVETMELGASITSKVATLPGPASYSWTRADLGQYLSFQVSPKTQIKISGIAKIVAKSSPPSDGTLTNSAKGQAVVQVGIYGQPEESKSFSFVINDNAALDVDKSETFELILKNKKNSFGNFDLTVSAAAESFTYFAPIPEPATLWMMLAGTGFLFSRLSARKILRTLFCSMCLSRRPLVSNAVCT